MTTTRPSKKTILAVAAFLLPIAGALAAGPMPHDEVSTAMKHSGFAMKEKEIKGVQMHLHHTLNCLVGPQGEGFDSSALNPCKGMGNGAINDTSGEMKMMLMHAAALARTAEQLHSYEAAKQTAMAVHTLLSEASKGK